MKNRIQAIQVWFEKYERHLSSLALVGGFIVDALTLRRVDLLLENLAIISYLIIAAVSIVSLNIIDVRRYSGKIADRLAYILPLVIQFAFGALFSGFTIFYFRSGSFITSWPFIIILIALLLGNELLRKHYARLMFQITTFFTALFFFTIFFVPVLINKIGPWTFVLSGLSALIIIGIFVSILFYFMPGRIISHKKILTYSIAFVFLLINLLYFTNLIPPIPLSLNSVGVYHSLVKNNFGYTALLEKESYLDKLQFFRNIHIRIGDPLYVYSAVFAPTDIETEIVHNWRHFDETTERWVSVSKIPYTIVGGNAGGYRGYSTKSNLSPGLWAVEVETSRGQVIGRITFEIIYVTELPKLEEKIFPRIS